MRHSIYNNIRVTGGPLIERRITKRFQVDWQVQIHCEDSEGQVINGVLRNLSSSGALLTITDTLIPGTQLDLYIKLPLSEKKWMKYPARVVRIENDTDGIKTAVSFDCRRPEFNLPHSPM